MEFVFVCGLFMNHQMISNYIDYLLFLVCPISHAVNNFKVQYSPILKLTYPFSPWELGSAFGFAFHTNTKNQKKYLSLIPFDKFKGA
jgi:hypothetical protein